MFSENGLSFGTLKLSLVQQKDTYSKIFESQICSKVPKLSVERVYQNIVPVRMNLHRKMQDVDPECPCYGDHRTCFSLCFAKMLFLFGLVVN